MRAAHILLVCGAVVLGPTLAWPQSAGTPTSPNSGSNPGAAATEQVTSPTRPPAEVAPPVAGRAAEPAGGTMTSGEIRELLDSTAATAKATRELVEYNRVVPDLLTQILTKLDKMEDKLGRMEDALKVGRRR